MQLEGNLISYANNVAQRRLRPAKYAVEAALAVFGALITNAARRHSSLSNAKPACLRPLIEGELAKLEIFKAQIEGQKLVSQINIQLVEIYKARLEGVRAQIEIFKEQIAAVLAQSEVNKNIIQAFGIRVQAYDSQVKAKASEYVAATRIKAEISN
jgi:hypothetical protein